jgi:hypothetical protein
MHLVWRAHRSRPLRHNVGADVQVGGVGAGGPGREVSVNATYQEVPVDARFVNATALRGALYSSAVFWGCSIRQ